MSIVCGIDEAGRGALAGPVSAGAVILGQDFPSSLAHRLRDSKKLSPTQRAELETGITHSAALWAVAFASSVEIDTLNILVATLRAMTRAFDFLWCPSLAAETSYVARGEAPRPPHSNRETKREIRDVLVIVDGIQVPPLDHGCITECRAVVGADATVPEVQAASIIAKTARDRWMREYATFDTRYQFERHKGYPTRAHRLLLARHGVCGIHRKSFSWREVSTKSDY